MRFLLRPAAKLVYDRLGEPELWWVEPHYVTYKRTKQKIWTANGRFFLNPYDPKLELFNVVEKFVLWHRIGRMVRESKRATRRSAEQGFIAKLTGMEEDA